MSKPRTWWSGIRPTEGSLKNSVLAALPRSAAAVPDGMAAAALVGVNPIHGLYASFVGPILGGLTASTKLMVITTTSAASLAAYSALQGTPSDEMLASLFLLLVLAGVLMLLAGFFGLGRFTAFVSHSVMTGFLTGVAVSILLGQIPDLVGATVEAGRSLGKAFEVISSSSSIDIPSLIIGVSALLLLAALPATKLAKYAALAALILPSLAVAFFGYFEGVAQVGDAGEIVSGLPTPMWPSFRLFSLDLLVGAFSVAVIVLVQGAGVAQAFPNPDRTRSNQNSDFMAQGLANVGSGLLGGTPVGGSVSQTALNFSVGARDRWASILSGLFVMLILVFFSGLAEKVAIPTLAAILIYASAGAVRPGHILAVWRSGMTAQIAMTTTFVATLVLPVAAAVGIGVALSLLLNFNREAQDVRLVSVTEREDGAMVEGPLPAQLTSRQVTVLNVYGSLFYAGARTLQERLPVVGDAEQPVVVISIRGKTQIGSTAFAVLSGYAEELGSQGGRLYLSGVERALIEQFERSGRIAADGPMRLVEVRPVIGESTKEAVIEGTAFLLSGPEEVVPTTPPEPWALRAVSGIGRMFGGERRSEPGDPDS